MHFLSSTFMEICQNYITLQHYRKNKNERKNESNTKLDRKKKIGLDFKA